MCGGWGGGVGGCEFYFLGFSIFLSLFFFSLNLGFGGGGRALFPFLFLFFLFWGVRCSLEAFVVTRIFQRLIGVDDTLRRFMASSKILGEETATRGAEAVEEVVVTAGDGGDGKGGKEGRGGG